MPVVYAYAMLAAFLVALHSLKENKGAATDRGAVEKTASPKTA